MANATEQALINHLVLNPWIYDFITEIPGDVMSRSSS